MRKRDNSVGPRKEQKFAAAAATSNDEPRDRTPSSEATLPQPKRDVPSPPPPPQSAPVQVIVYREKENENFARLLYAVGWVLFLCVNPLVGIIWWFLVGARTTACFMCFVPLLSLLFLGTVSLGFMHGLLKT